MNVRQWIVVSLISIAACNTSPPSPAQTQPVTVPTKTILPTHTLVATSIPTGTHDPFATPIPSSTPIITIPPQPGFDVWEAGSVEDVYAVQFPTATWTEEGNSLKHTSIPHCSIGLHGGSDICMAGGCTGSSVILGEIRFGRTTVGKNLSIYVSSDNAVRAWISYEIFGDEQPETCRKDGEAVLATLRLRPERGCVDRAAFVADLTMPDNTPIPAGTKFVKTWRLKNVGTCTWTQAYTLVVYGTSPGTESDWVALPKEVLPEETVDLSIDLPATSMEGTARWEAALTNELGDSFGLGSEPYPNMTGKPFWVQIKVVPATQ